MHGEDVKCIAYNIFVRKREGTGHIGDSGVRGKIILKRIQKKHVMMWG
jgi:hypothetical protein